MKNYKKALFIAVCSLSFFPSVRSAKVDLEKVKKTIDQKTIAKKGITLGQFLKIAVPALNKIKWPPFVDKSLSHLVFYAATVKEDKKRGVTEISLGNPKLFGVKRKLTLRFYSGPGTKGGRGTSIGFGIPGAWSFNDIFPEIKAGLKKLEAKLLPKELRDQFKRLHISVDDLSKMVDWIKYANIGVVNSDSEFNDPVWGKLKSGINTKFMLKIGGPLKKMTDVFGKNLTEVEFRGLIVPSLTFVGSEARVVLPGKLNLVNIGKGLPGLKIRTSDVEFRVGIRSIPDPALPGTDMPIPSIKLQSGFDVKFPFQKDFVTFKGSVDILPPAKAEISAEMDGMLKNMFGLPGVNMGNLGLQITLAPPPPELPIPEPLTGFAIKGDLEFGKLKLDAIVKVEVLPLLNELGDIIIQAKYHGLTSDDIVDFVVSVMKETGKVTKINVPREAIDVITKLVMKFNVYDFELSIVPKTARVFGKTYPKGYHIKAMAELFGVRGGLEASLTFGAVLGVLPVPILKGKIFLKEVRIPKTGPPLLILSGTGIDKKFKGPIVDINLDIKSPHMYMDSLLKIPFLGIEDHTRIKITKSAIEFDAKHKLGGLFDAELHFKANIIPIVNIINPVSIKVSGYVKDKAISQLSNLLTKEAHKALGQAQKNLNKAKSDVQRWNTQAVRDINKHFDTLRRQTQANIKTENGKADRGWKECVRQHPYTKVIDVNLIPRGICAETLGVNAAKIKSAALTAYLNVALPTARGVALAGEHVLSGVAQAGLNVAKTAVSDAQALSNFAGQIIGGAFNIKRVTILEGNLQNLFKTGKLPDIRVEGIILGKKFKQDYQIDFKHPGQFPAQVFNGLKQILGIR